MHALTDTAEFLGFARASHALYRRLDGEWDGAIGLRSTRWLHLLPPAVQNFLPSDVGSAGPPVV